MTKPNKQAYIDAHLRYFKAKYPSVAEHAIPVPKASDNSANNLTKMVINYIQWNGYQAERISSMGRYIENKRTVIDAVGFQRTIGSGQWIKGTTTKGTADISATIKGRSVKIEIKYGKDRQSEYQKQYEEAVTSAGGIYKIIHTFDEFIEFFNNLH
jgi:hypothetical protein